MAAAKKSTSNEARELLFGGDPVAPPPEVFAEARRRQPALYRAMEEAYAQYAARPENVGRLADPKGSGATLVQIARFFGLFGVRPICVLARLLPAAHTEGLDRLDQRSAAEVLAALKHLRGQDGELNVTTLHHDGKTGHCIRLTDYDPETDRFEYHDSWPGRSLLCEENNRRGVRAAARGTRWTVRPEELASVLVCCFVFPAYWSRAVGDAANELREEAFGSGEFARHFRLKHLGEVRDGPVVRHAYAPGPFGNWLQLETDVRPGGRISAARLIADKGWLRDNIELGIDLVKSFVLAIAPQGPGEGVFQEIAGALWSVVRDPAAALRLRNTDPGESKVVACVHAFGGSLERATASTELASLTIGSLVLDSKPYLRIEIDLF